MPINRTIYIESSVGRGGANKYHDVHAVQSQLNDQMSHPRIKLVTDGLSGPKTRSMIYDFQKSVLGFNRPDSRVDPGGQTLAALNDPAAEQMWASQPIPNASLPDIQHDIPLIPQPTSTTCWAAATAMLTGRSVQQVIRTTPSELVMADGSLRNYSGQDDWVTGTRSFAEAHGLRYVAPQSWTAGKLRSFIERGPLCFDMLWNSSDYARGAASPGHVICITGVSNGANAEMDVTYNDPWKPNVGKVRTVNYASWMQDVPTRTYRVFYR